MTVQQKHKRAASPVFASGGRSFFRRLWQNSNGATAMEFAMLMPVFLTVGLGSLDMGQMVYGKSILNGAVLLAARNATLESADTTQADAIVLGQVAPILPGVSITSARTNYYDFADIGRPERWNDTNGDGACNAGESYVDENDNGHWDNDVGRSGNGGANDVVVYTATATYRPVFKVPLMPASWGVRKLTSTVIKKNQPYASQAAYGTTAGTC